MEETVAQEIRIATLEKQLHDLLRWKQSISSLLGVAFTAFDNALSHTEKSKPPVSMVKFHKAAEAIQTTISAKDISVAPTWAPGHFIMPASVEKQPRVVRLDAPPVVVKKMVKAFAETSEGPVLPIHVKPNPIASASQDMAFKVLDIIQRYGQNLKNSELQGSTFKDQWLGRAKFAPKVEMYVEAGLPIKMILPSFPWKSVSNTP